MPCYDYSPSEERDAAYDKIDKLTRMLCSLLKAGERHGGPTPPVEVRLWWEDHKKKDAKRLAEEKREKEEKQVRAAALKKLTPAERKALRL